jgi:SAM-dependent methyltransferase
MDEATLNAYERDAAGFAKEWNEQPSPLDMYDLLSRYFRPGPTADIGCGSGRDLAWLVSNGYDACGFDASPALVRQARSVYDELDVREAALPALEGVPRNFFENVLCETVIMHLDSQDVGLAVTNLFGLVRPGGTLYLSWRVTENQSERDNRGRLYSAFDKQCVVDALSPDAVFLFDREDISASSGKRVHRLVVRKVSAA